jgi:hypothetical protein
MEWRSGNLNCELLYCSNPADSRSDCKHFNRAFGAFRRRKCSVLFLVLRIHSPPTDEWSKIPCMGVGGAGRSR